MTYEGEIYSVDPENITMLRTDDEVDLRTEFERKKLMAHELVHLDRFNDTKFCGALSV